MQGASLTPRQARVPKRVWDSKAGCPYPTCLCGPRMQQIANAHWRKESGAIAADGLMEDCRLLHADCRALPRMPDHLFPGIRSPRSRLEPIRSSSVYRLNILGVDRSLRVSLPYLIFRMWVYRGGVTLIRAARTGDGGELVTGCCHS